MTTTQRHSAPASGFDSLSAQAPACEIAHSKFCHNMLAGPLASTSPAVHHTTAYVDACLTQHGPGWVLEAPQGEQPGHVSDVSHAPGAIDLDIAEQLNSGHSGCSIGGMLYPSAITSLACDASYSQHAPILVGAVSDMVTGWVPGAPPLKGSSLIPMILIRALKRYPSCVLQLQLEPISQASLEQEERHRQARVEQDSVRFATRCYSDVVAAGGGEPLRYTFPVEFASVGSSLVEAVLAEIVHGPSRLCLRSHVLQMLLTS